MDAAFWHRKWQSGDIGFHLAEVNPALLAHFSTLQLALGSRVLLPLCGKTRDIGWLLAQGMSVIGVELSDVAVSELFAELACTPNVSEHGALRHYSAPQLDIWCGDLFTVTSAQLGDIDAIYDRAALVALPESLRGRYTGQLLTLGNGAKQLLVSFEYQQSLLAGPPFSVVEDEIAQHYQQYYSLSLLAREPIAGGLKGQVPANNTVWLLTPLAQE